jgi:hypothetical protein
MERISDWKMSGEIWLTRRFDVEEGMALAGYCKCHAGCIV